MKKINVFKAIDILEEKLGKILNLVSITIKFRKYKDKDKALEALIFYDDSNFTSCIYSFNSKLSFEELIAKVIEDAEAILIKRSIKPVDAVTEFIM